MKRRTQTAIFLACAWAGFGAPAMAASSDERAAPDASADIAIEADRAYAFIEPRDGRITALLIANGRPSLTLSIDPRTAAVDVTTADGRIARHSFADLADAYAQGDAERRAAFLVSMQRAVSAAGTSACATGHCDADAASAQDERANDMPIGGDDRQRLAAIARWAADHVGSERVVVLRGDGARDTAIPMATDAARDAATDKRERRALFDPWQTGMQVPELLRSLGDLVRP